MISPEFVSDILYKINLNCIEVIRYKLSSHFVRLKLVLSGLSFSFGKLLRTAFALFGAREKLISCYIETYSEDVFASTIA